MLVHKDEVKRLRTEKAWTQGQLADACDLSLRTIQRVEKDAIASAETVQALAAVLEVSARDLSVVPKQESLHLEEYRPLRRWYMWFALWITGVLFGMGFMRLLS